MTNLLLKIICRLGIPSVIITMLMVGEAAAISTSV
jgi:hypothetical protein